MDSFRFEGHDISYLRAGSGEPIVFLHNGGTTHRVWTPQFEYFAATHDVIAPDMLGYGASAKPRVDYTLGLYVRMLSALIEHLDLRAVTLVGNCIGAATALRYAAGAPERVKQVVAINILTPDTVARGALGPFIGLARRSALAAKLLGRLPVPAAISGRVFQRTHFVDPARVDPAILADLRGRYRDRAQNRVLMSLAANMRSFTAADPVADVNADADAKVQVLTVWAASNHILPLSAGRRLGPASQPTTIVPGGHLAMLEQPEAVIAAIESMFVDARGSQD
ncbi:alpha/beta fold hydrolase [Catenulispora pinisilvae]|uniref:alpha/beta fold hydrolase n=1 Tax=Catenulispora pinisilvae TaxID=2705253 RepID=UPI001890F322|nr:alpha/beta hydrolase [Catenulispora pinisilvae]